MTSTLPTVDLDAAQLDLDRDLAMRTLRPRQGSHDYATLTDSGRAEVDRLVFAFTLIRRSCKAGHLIGSPDGWTTYVCCLTGPAHALHVDSQGRTWKAA